MRRVKLSRFWDKKKKEMNYGTCGEYAILIDSGELVEHDYSLECDCNTGAYIENIDDDVIIMDYIGREDAKSNKLYEDDIVSLIDELYIVKWDEDTLGYVLVRTRLDVDGEYVKIGLHLCFKNATFRVGNIFENPELLKGVN